MTAPIDRRTFLTITAAAGGTRLLGVRFAGAAPVDALPPATFVSFTQRVLVDRILSSEPAALVAFGNAAKVASGRLAEFARARTAFQAASPQDRIAMLGEQLGHGLGLDLRASLTNDSVAIGDFAQALTNRTGLGLTVGGILDATGVRHALGDKTLDDVTRLLGANSTSLDVLPVFGDLLDARGAIGRLEQAAHDNGLLGLIAGAGATLAKLTDPARLQQLSKAFTNLTDEAGKLFKGALDLKSFPSLDGLADAVQVVGNLIHADPGTLSTINKVIKTVGAVVQGVQMGASFGPVGAVVGGAIGLITSLFGGEPARDPTLDALSALDAKLVQIHADMMAGMKALSEQIAQGFQAVNTALIDIRTSIATLQQQMLREFDDVKQRLYNIRHDDLVLLGADVEIAADEHERAYRRHAADQASRQFESTASVVRTSIQRLSRMLDSPGEGFAGPAVVGTGSLSAAINKRLINPAASYDMLTLLPLSRRFAGRAYDRLQVAPFGGTTPLAKQLYPDNAVPAIPRLTWFGDDMTTAIRDAQYRHSDSTIGPPAIHELQLRLVDQLRGLASSGEWRYMTREQRSWVPSTAGASQAQPIAPSDLSLVASNVGAAVSKLTDPALASELIELALPLLRARVANHQLFSDQNMSIALLYARRIVATKLAGLIANVFCGRAMTAARVLRCAASSVLSKSANATQNHATLVRDSAKALALFDASAMPLAEYRSAALGTPPKSLKLALDELLPTLGPLDGALDPNQIAIVWQVTARRGNELAQVLSTELTNSGNSTPMTRLIEIVSTGVLLATIESSIETRLSVLRLAGIAAPTFVRYSDGFEEYVLLAAHAYGNAHAGPSAQAELTAANILVLAHVYPPIRDIAVTPGAQLPAAARPFPIEIGHLWGWGAEDYVLDTATSDVIVRAVMDPHCAMAGSNNAIERAAAICVALDSAALEIKLAQTAARRLGPKQLVDSLRAAVRV